MTGFTLHPFETSICLWALVFSLLTCLIMLLMRKVLLRNCILFFFWFMVNAVFQVLEITALGREDVLAYRSLIQIVYMVNTFVIVLGIGAGIQRGFGNIFRFSKQEWIYIGVNGLAVFAILSSLIMIGELGPEGFGTRLMLFLSAFGVIAFLAAFVADLTVFSPLHRRLRRSSPRMIYVFCAALFPACMLVPAIFGLHYAGPVYTVMMMVYLILYMLGRMSRRGTVPAAETLPDVISSAAEKSAVSLEQGKPRIRIVKEYVKTDDASLLAQNPHFVCNALNTISYQIDHNPAGAQKAVNALGDYMQGKYTGLKADHMVPFESEIKTVNSYLELQKMRYEDQLNVVTDYKANGFFVPALSLVTVLEHIVTNILQRRAEGGLVRIETANETDSDVIRIICDDDINDEDSLKHICSAFPLLKTVRERLDRFCGGTFEAVRDGSRSVFLIRIPIRQEDEDSAASAPSAADPV